jgi:hypothetical protein
MLFEIIDEKKFTVSSTKYETTIINVCIKARQKRTGTNKQPKKNDTDKVSHATSQVNGMVCTHLAAVCCACQWVRLRSACVLFETRGVGG